MYQTYIFDLYGTLIDIHTDEENLKLWECMRDFFSFYGANYTLKELKQSYHQIVQAQEENLKIEQSKKNPNKEVFPEIDMFCVIKELYLRKEIDVSKDIIKLTGQFFRTGSTEYIRLYKGAEDLLRELKKKGKQIILLSNAQRVFTEHEIKALGIDIYFDDIFISSDYGVKKPDLNFFALPYKKHGLSKNNTIMIGNDPNTDILGAQKFGFDTCYLHSNISPKKEDPVNSTYSQDPMDLIALKEMLIFS